jgi:autotransporter family porin
MQRKTQIWLALSALAALTWVDGASESQAGCTPAPTAGNDTIACSASTPPDPTPGTIDLLGGNDRVDMVSGTYGGLTGTTGNKTLIFGLGGGNPTITGTVIFGSGRDTIEIHSGTIVGAIDQSGGIDSFLMTGGTIQSLDQGADRDVAVITGGWIIGLFTDGDDFTMTGGRIGLVNLRAGNNIMRMSGGSIDSNVIAEQGDDRLELSGGVIGGFVDFGNGNNTIIVTGGQIGNGIITGNGADQLVWSGGGIIAGPITLGAGNDMGTLSGLTSVHLAALTLLDGGTDTLTFDGTEATGVARFQRWETIVLSNASRLTLDAPLVLGTPAPVRARCRSMRPARCSPAAVRCRLSNHSSPAIWSA